MINKRKSSRFKQCGASRTRSNCSFLRRFASLPQARQRPLTWRLPSRPTIRIVCCCWPIRVNGWQWVQGSRRTIIGRRLVRPQWTRLTRTNRAREVGQSICGRSVRSGTVIRWQRHGITFHWGLTRRLTWGGRRRAAIWRATAVQVGRGGRW